MKAASSSKAVPRRLDAGFTLIELLIALVLSSLVVGVTVAALATSLNIASSTTDQVNDSTDAGLITSFLFRDAQSAGATDPGTAQIDTTVGVSTVGSGAGWSGCAQPGTLVVRFSWADRISASTQRTVVATYALDSQKQLIRRLCKDGTTIDVVLGHSVSAAKATCMPDPACAGNPSSVALAMSGSGARAPFSYTLTASLRRTKQATPEPANSSPVALVLLGDPSSSATCPNLTLGGTGTVTVIGDALVDVTCGPPAITGDSRTLQPTGATSAIAGIGDPFLGRRAPANSCADGGKNPASIGASPDPDAVTTYPQTVSIDAPLTFKSGRYVFCAGLNIGAGGRVAGTDIVLYFAGGSLAVDANATIDLTAFTTGPDANLLIWVATPQTVTIAGGPRISSYRGIVYAPSSTLRLSSALATDFGGLIVQKMIIGGQGAFRIGLPVPMSAISPPSIPMAQVGVAYAATLTSPGATSPARWTATGLPPGFSIDSSTGMLSGTPTTSGSFGIVVTMFDATAAAVTIDYPISVAAK